MSFELTPVCIRLILKYLKTIQPQNLIGHWQHFSITRTILNNFVSNAENSRYIVHTMTSSILQRTMYIQCQHCMVFINCKGSLP